jgi:hypothetical protein
MLSGTSSSGEYGVQACRDCLGPEAQGLPNEDIIHKFMCKVLDYRQQVTT